VSGCVGHCDGQADRNPKSRPAYRVVRAGQGWPKTRQEAETESRFAGSGGADCDCTPRGAGEGLGLAAAGFVGVTGSSDISPTPWKLYCGANSSG
jgi:hypothetical protein